MSAYDGRWRLHGSGAGKRRELWSAPATSGRWIRFAFDVTYSSDPALGSVRAFADLNGDGDALDHGERSGRLSLRTLKNEGPGTVTDGVEQGASIPSHLRVGVYHDPSYRCHRYRCAVDVDNVGIYAG